LPRKTYIKNLHTHGISEKPKKQNGTVKKLSWESTSSGFKMPTVTADFSDGRPAYVADVEIVQADT
jgi:hypothetical protein